MRTPTTAEQRTRHLDTLARRADHYADNPAQAWSEASKAMNSFYRLAAYSLRLFYINNDYDLYTRYQKHGRLARMEAREAEWIARVNRYLAPFHARAVFNGVYPSICDEKHPDDHGTITDLFLTAWY